MPAPNFSILAQGSSPHPSSPVPISLDANNSTSQAACEQHLTLDICKEEEHSLPTPWQSTTQAAFHMLDPLQPYVAPRSPGPEIVPATEL